MFNNEELNEIEAELKSDTMNFRRQPHSVTVKVSSSDNRDAYEVFQNLNRALRNSSYDIDYETKSGEYTLILHPYAVND